MYKLVLGLALALASFAGTAHAAGGKHIVASSPGALKNYLKNTNGQLVKKSAAHNSTYYKFTTALEKSPKSFRKIVLFHGIDESETAYIPKVYIKGLKGNTAFVQSFNLVNRDQLRTVGLPLFAK